MQFLMLKTDLITDKNITSNEFRVYSYLLLRHNEEKGYAYPAIETIADRIGVSQATVKRSIKKLEKLGYIEISKRKSISGNNNLYRNLKHLITSKIKDAAVRKVEKDKNTKEERTKENNNINIEENNNNMAESETSNADHEVSNAGNENINSNKIDNNTSTNNYKGNFDKNNKINNNINGSKIVSSKNLDNNRLVRMARGVTNIDKSNFAKTVISMSDEHLLREAIKIFKKKKGKNSTFLIKLLVDEYYRYQVNFTKPMLNLLRSGLKDPLIVQPS